MSSLQSQDKNILKIKNLNLQNLKFSVAITISAMNIFYLDEALDWAKLNNFEIIF